MRRFFASVAAMLLAAVPASAQTYFAALNPDNSVARLAEIDASNAAAPSDGSCPGCAVVTQAQYQAYQAQLAAAALAASGTAITLTSASTPALNGTYAVDPAATANINAVATYIASKTTPGQALGTGATFPTGGATMPWKDTSGTPHIFASPAQFIVFGQAVAQYVTLYALGQNPSNAISIP